MYEFFPEGFVPDDEFNKRAESLRRRDFLLLWIENPTDVFGCWRWTGCRCPGSISIGRYRLFLSRLLSSEASELKFSGTFVSGGIEFDTSEIVLSLPSGVLSFSISRSDGRDVFKALGAEIRYVMANDPEQSANGSSQMSAFAFSNTLLRYPGNGTFKVTLDLNGLLDPNRTFILLPKEKFESNLTDCAGEAIFLDPLEDASLVFERAARSVCFDRGRQKRVTAQHELYLGYRGSFHVNGGEVLTGLYGMEYMRGCSEITLRPGYPAFIDGELSASVGLGCESAVTSWISLHGDYYSMPENMPLYALKDGMLQTYETPAAVFSQGSEPVPFFPWKNARISEGLDVRAADDILYRARCGILSGDIERARFFSADSEVTAVTPAGMCAGIDGGAWKWLGIAQTSNDPLPNVRINDITPEGRRRLLQKDCFIVISSKEEYQSFGCGDICIETDGWIITLSEKNWNSSILIIKYRTDVCVKDKLSDNAAFKRLLNAAYVGSEVKESFKGFIDAVTSEKFEGVMLLNVLAQADESKLSPEVYAAAAMTGEKYLGCVYAAVKHSRVDLNDGKLNVALSQTDALIAYDQGGITQSNKELTCKTVALEAVIKASRVTAFASRTEILPKRLFGELLSEPKCIALLGRADMQNNAAVYRFSLENDVCYVPQNKPITLIAINAASMSSSGGQSRFWLSGSLSAVCGDCDIFSYDELAFEGAAIVCGAENAREDLSELRLRGDKSRAREGSFAKTFGVFADRYIVNSEAKSPDELGFSSITAPVRQGEIGAGWNGMICKLSLGNSGSLGADSPLYFDFICAWKDGGYYFGVRPGDVFSKQFTLQSLLGVGFQSVSLIKSEKGAPMFKLNSLTLKLLGLSVPPKSADLFIFGDNGKIGWFFGYSK